MYWPDPGSTVLALPEEKQKPESEKPKPVHGEAPQAKTREKF
jgi:hypothetical protein